MKLPFGNYKNWFKPKNLALIFSILLALSVLIVGIPLSNLYSGIAQGPLANPPKIPSPKTEIEAPSFVVPEISSTIATLVPMLSALYLNRNKNKK